MTDLTSLTLAQARDALQNKNFTATELADFLKPVPAENVTIAIHPCFSGGFLSKLGGIHGQRVIVTSTDASQVNANPWIETFTSALSIRGRK